MLLLAVCELAVVGAGDHVLGLDVDEAVEKKRQEGASEGQEPIYPKPAEGRSCVFKHREDRDSDSNRRVEAGTVGRNESSCAVDHLSGALVDGGNDKHVD